MRKMHAGSLFEQKVVKLIHNVKGNLASKRPTYLEREEETGQNMQNSPSDSGEDPPYVLSKRSIVKIGSGRCTSRGRSWQARRFALGAEWVCMATVRGFWFTAVLEETTL